MWIFVMNQFDYNMDLMVRGFLLIRFVMTENPNVQMKEFLMASTSLPPPFLSIKNPKKIK